MIGPTEIILLAIIVLYLGFVIWSFSYVIRKSSEIKRLNPYALSVWKFVIIHIFIIIVVNSIGVYILPSVLKLFVHPISCLILPVYLKIKYKNVCPTDDKT